MLLLIRVN